MTDNKIIKALDICGHLEACADCPLGCLEGVDKCMHTLLLNALDLINRQKAEVERLQAEKNEWKSSAIKCADQRDETERKYGNLIFSSMVGKVRAEAIKEFAERLIDLVYEADDINPVSEWSIRGLVKEMTEEQK